MWLGIIKCQGCHNNELACIIAEYWNFLFEWKTAFNHSNYLCALLTMCMCPHFLAYECGKYNFNLLNYIFPLFFLCPQCNVASQHKDSNVIIVDIFNTSQFNLTHTTYCCVCGHFGFFKYVL